MSMQTRISCDARIRPPLRKLALGGRAPILLLLWLLPDGLGGQEPTASPTPAAETASSPAEPPPDPSDRPSPGCARLEQPVLLRRVEPEYPADVRRQGLQGFVILQGRVDTNGEVTEVRPLQSPSEALSKLASAAVRQWRYKPALCDGKPMRVYLTVTSNFRLDRPTSAIMSHPNIVRPVDASCASPTAPILVHRIEPTYPKGLGKFRVEGTVILEGIVGTDGGVSAIRVISSPSEPLSRSAAEALGAWRYQPATCDGKPVRVYVTMTSHFRYRN